METLILGLEICKLQYPNSKQSLQKFWQKFLASNFHFGRFSTSEIANISN